jgi:hypothetical protein
MLEDIIYHEKKRSCVRGIKSAGSSGKVSKQKHDKPCSRNSKGKQSFKPYML